MQRIHLVLARWVESRIAKVLSLSVKTGKLVSPKNHVANKHEWLKRMINTYTKKDLMHVLGRVEHWK